MVLILFVGGLIAELRELEDKLQERRQLKFGDKGKASKFRKQRDELPAHVLHLMEVESKGKLSPRQFQSLVINKLYKRNTNRILSLSLSDPLVTEHQKAPCLLLEDEPFW